MAILTFTGLTAEQQALAVQGPKFLWMDNGRYIVYTGTDMPVVQKEIQPDYERNDFPNATNDTQLYNALNWYGGAVIPRGADFIVDGLVVPDNAVITGTGTLRWLTSDTANKTLTLGNGSRLENISLKPDVANISAAKTIAYVATNSVDTVVSGIRLQAERNADGSTLEKLLVLEQHCDNVTVEGVRTKNGGYPFIGIDTTNSHFVNNKFYSGSSAMNFYGGKFNNILGNKVYGTNVHGTTGAPTVTNKSTRSGINMLTFGFLGRSRGIVGNIIAGNHVFGVSEEAIGLDTHGNSAADSAENPWIPLGTVWSVGIQNNHQIITVQEPTTTNGVPAPSNWANDCFMCVLTGANTGYMVPVVNGFSVESSLPNTASFRIPLSGGPVNLAKGDKILITYGIVDNTIESNVVRSSTTGVSLWGSSWSNVVNDNSISAIDAGVQVASVLGGAATPGVNKNTLGYSGGNSITDNRIRLEYSAQSELTARGISPLRIGTWAYGTPDPTIPNNVNSTISDNKIVSCKDTLVGGSFGSVDAGTSTVSGTVVADNKLSGQGTLVVGKTTDVSIGKNYRNGIREDYNAVKSTTNTRLSLVG